MSLIQNVFPDVITFYSYHCILSYSNGIANGCEPVWVLGLRALNRAMILHYLAAIREKRIVVHEIHMVSEPIVEASAL